MSDIAVDAQITAIVEEARIREQFGVSERQAEALVGAFGTADAVVEASHKALLTVDGIGPMTADRITPKSVRLRWVLKYSDGIVPIYTDENGYMRHPSERDTHPKKQIENPYD